MIYCSMCCSSYSVKFVVLLERFFNNWFHFVIYYWLKTKLFPFLLFFRFFAAIFFIFFVVQAQNLLEFASEPKYFMRSPYEARKQAAKTELKMKRGILIIGSSSFTVRCYAGAYAT